MQSSFIIVGGWFRCLLLLVVAGVLGFWIAWILDCLDDLSRFGGQSTNLGVTPDGPPGCFMMLIVTGS